MDSNIVSQPEQRPESGVAEQAAPQSASTTNVPTTTTHAPQPAPEAVREPQSSAGQGASLSRDGEAYTESINQEASETAQETLGDAMEGVQQDHPPADVGEGRPEYNAFLNDQEGGHAVPRGQSHGHEGHDDAGMGHVTIDGEAAQNVEDGHASARVQESTHAEQPSEASQRDDHQHHGEPASQDQDEAGKSAGLTERQQEKLRDTHNPFAEEPLPIAVEAATQLKAPAFLIKLYNILSDPDPQVKALIHWASPEAVHFFAEASAQAERLQAEGLGQRAPSQTQGVELPAGGSDVTQHATSNGEAGPDGEQPSSSSQQHQPPLDKAPPLAPSEAISYDFFVVEDAGDFSKLVLPRYFKHNNWQSFVRQLNMYDFRKLNDFAQAVTTTGPGVWHWRHPYFQRGRPGMLSRIERKAVGGASASKKRKSEIMKSELSQVPGAIAGTKAAALAAKTGGGDGSLTGALKTDGSAKGEAGGQDSSSGTSLLQEVDRLKARLDEQSQQLAEMRMHVTAVWQLMSAQSGFAADAIEQLAGGSSSSAAPEEGALPAQEAQAGTEERLHAARRSATSIRSLMSVMGGLGHGGNATEAGLAAEGLQSEAHGAEGASSTAAASTAAPASTHDILSSVPLFLQLVNSGSSDVAQAATTHGVLANGGSGENKDDRGHGIAGDGTDAHAGVADAEGLPSSDAAEEDHPGTAGSPTSPNDGRKRKKARTHGPGASQSQGAHGSQGAASVRPSAAIQPPATLQELLSQANALAAAQAEASANTAHGEGEGEASQRDDRMDEAEDVAHVAQEADQGDADADADGDADADADADGEAMDDSEAAADSSAPAARAEEDAARSQPDRAVTSEEQPMDSQPPPASQTDTDIYGARALASARAPAIADEGQGNAPASMPSVAVQAQPQGTQQP